MEMTTCYILQFIIICFCQQKDGTDELEEGTIWCKNARGRSYQLSQAAWLFKRTSHPPHHSDETIIMMIYFYHGDGPWYEPRERESGSLILGKNDDF